MSDFAQKATVLKPTTIVRTLHIASSFRSKAERAHVQERVGSRIAQATGNAGERRI
jgi:hypothetical protein